MKFEVRHEMAQGAAKETFEMDPANLSATDAGKIFVVNSYGKLVLLALPADAATKTYTLKAVNGVLTWA